MDNLYYPVNPTPGGDPFGGRFGNNPGLLNYLIANGFQNQGTPATPPPTTPPVANPPPPQGNSGAPYMTGGGSGHGNDSGGYHGSSGGAGGGTGGFLGGGEGNVFGGGQWAGPGQVNLGRLGRTAMQMGSMIPGPIGMGLGLANMGLRGYNIGQFDGQLNGIGLPGLSFGQTLGGVLGMNSYGSGNWGANGLLGVSNNGDNYGSMGVAPGAALGGYNGQGRPTAIGQIGGPFGAHGMVGAGSFAGAGDPGGMGARAAAAAMGRGSSIGNGMGGPGNGGGGAFSGGGDGPSLSGGR